MLRSEFEGIIIALDYGKEVKKKAVKKASDAFHSIMKASVAGNPKPKPKKESK